MCRRIAVLLSLVIIMATATSLTSLAGSAPSEPAEERDASRSVAQASPVAGADAVHEGLTIAIVAGDRPGVFEFYLSGGPPHVGGAVIWSNDSSVTHDLRISVQGTVTSTVEIEPEESFMMHFHEAGNVRFVCTLHGEEGDFRVE
jgi:plastocyanin